MLKSATSLATLALVAASFTFSGCGGSSHQAGSLPTHSAPASSQAATPAPAASTAGSSSDPRSVPGQCVSLSNSDPAAFTICLAKHGVHLSAGDGKLTTCVQSASDKAELDRCLSEAVR
jgi:hypothetical protein